MVFKRSENRSRDPKTSQEIRRPVKRSEDRSRDPKSGQEIRRPKKSEDLVMHQNFYLLSQSGLIGAMIEVWGVPWGQQRGCGVTPAAMWTSGWSAVPSGSPCSHASASRSQSDTKKTYN